MKYTEKMVTVAGVERVVALEEVSLGVYKGRVGKAFVFFDTLKYELPYYKIPGFKGDKETGERLTLFIESYISSLTKSPMHFDSFEGGDADVISSAPAGPDKKSKVPIWMKEDHKEWVPCHSRKTGELLYFRRARFKEDSRSIVDQFLPHCQNCPFASSCEKPCSDKESMSSVAVVSQ